MLLWFDSNKNKWLSDLIEKERNKVGIQKSKRTISSFLSDVYKPTIKTFSLVAGAVVILFAIAHLNHIIGWLISLVEPAFSDLSAQAPQYLAEASNHNLLTIHGGIGVIVFALLIFIAESLRDDETKDRARVLLRESYLFPLVVATILVFFIFGFGKTSFIGSLVSVSAVAAFTIWSLSRIIRVLLSRHRFAKKRIQMLKERMIESIDLAINERIGNQILLSKIDNELKLDYRISTIRNNENYYLFKAGNSGTITDVNTEKLKAISEFIDQEGERNDYSYTGEEKPTNIVTGSGQEISEGESENLTVNRERYILKRFHDTVEGENSVLIAVDKNLLQDDAVITDVADLVDQTFKIQKEENFAEEVRNELSGVKDQCTVAIENNQVGKVEEIKELYKEIAEGFLDKIGGYTAKQAEKERHSLDPGWEQIKWLSSDIKQLLDVAMHGKNQEIIGIIAYLPISISVRAIRQNDHYLFQEFIRFTETLYRNGRRIEEEKLKNHLVDRSWRYLNEVSIYLESQLSKYSNNQEKVVSFKNFGEHILFIYQRLLKEAFDNRELEHFETFKRKCVKAFERTSYVRNKWFSNELGRRKRQMWFGLASWIADKLISSEDNGQLQEFYSLINEELDIGMEQFTEVFLDTYSFDVEDFWGWGNWELFEKETGEVHAIQTLGRLERFYALKSLSMLSNKTDREIENIELPYSRDMSHLADGGRMLGEVLNDVQENPDNWRAILSDEAIDKVDDFQDLLQQAKENQEEQERQEKRERQISCKKVEQFKNEVMDNFYNNVIIRDIFTSYINAYKENIDGVTSETDRFGISMVDDKAAYFDDWHIQYSDWGRSYGNSLAQGENLDLFYSLSENCEIEDTSDIETALSKFEDVSNLLVITAGTAMWYYFRDLDKFHPKWRSKTLDINGFKGWYTYQNQEIPVFNTYNNEANQILLIDAEKVGDLVQLNPLNREEDAVLMKGIFYMNVESFSEQPELLDRFLENPPQWLQEEGDEEEQREYLMERVLVNIFERYAFEEGSETIGYKIYSAEEDDS